MIRQRIEQLRRQIKRQGLDAYYFSGTDPHQSEDLPGHWQTREFITGFSGSAGFVAVTENKAALWTDSRYFLQAASELEETGIELMKLRMEGTPSAEEWLASLLTPGSVVGTDSRCISLSQYRNFRLSLKQKKIDLKPCGDLLSGFWYNREPLPDSPVFEHDLKYAGLGRAEKMDKIRQLIGEAGAQSTVITALDDLAWTFNLRGSDIICNPVFIGYGLITADSAQLFIAPAKVRLPLAEKLNQEGIVMKPYEAVFEELKQLKGVIALDPGRTSQALADAIPEDVRVVEQLSAPARLKAVKSETELRHIRRTMKKDGAAMISFLYWLDQNIGNENISDYDIGLKVEYFRSLQEGFRGASFPPIVGYGETGALIHRRTTKENAVPVEKEGILLIDSGGQYVSGTTDITRTIALSPPTPQQKADFTRALKGMISLTAAKFPAGTKGCNLDILARKAMWDEGINYGHGTSHGVGYFLNVHEGPMNIRQEFNEYPILPGMVLSNEPGLYREGQYGIRTENMMVCVKREKTGFGQFYGFETLTLCPVDLPLIDTKLLTPTEISWINSYHKWCYDELSPFVNNDEKHFLSKLTLPLK
ncbi:MAG: aminopeptidase P family protein [Prolixibacteraceae bacterium]